MKKLLSVLLVVLASCTYHDLHVNPCFLSSEQNLSGSVTYFYNNQNQLVSYAASNVYSSVLTYYDSGKILSSVYNQVLSIISICDTKIRLTLTQKSVKNFSGFNRHTKC